MIIICNKNPIEQRKNQQVLKNSVNDRQTKIKLDHLAQQAYQTKIIKIRTIAEKLCVNKHYKIHSTNL